MTSAHLSLFSVRLSLHDVDSEADPDAVRELADELSMRPHLGSSKVSWGNSERNVIEVYTETEGLEPSSTGNAVAEELFEASVAVLRKLDGIHVEVLEVAQLEN